MQAEESDLRHHRGGEASSPGFRERQFEEKPGERMGSRECLVHSPCNSTIEEDLSEPCPRYPLVDIEQDENLVLSKAPAPSPLQRTETRKP